MALFDCNNISLKEKSSNTTQVKKLQEALSSLKYYTRSIDGDFGYYTTQAVKKFQTTYKLTVDGWFGPTTCKELNRVMEPTTTNATSTVSTTSTSTAALQFDCPKTTLKKGDSGEDVKKLQTMLKALGYYSDVISGNFKDNTDKGVKAFQRATGHDDDGVFGPKTCPDLNKAYKEYIEKTNPTGASNVVTTPSSPYLSNPNVTLIVLPEVVVLPENEDTGANNTGATSGGSVSTETNFDCTKIDLHKNSNGSDVTKLQTILKARGFYTRQIDGDYGKYTVEGVKKLQKSLGVTVDGAFGPVTCKALQGTNTTSNTNTGTAGKKSKDYVIQDFKYTPQITCDLEGLSHEVTLVTPYSFDKWSHIRKLQKTELTLYNENILIKQHKGYISNLKVSQEDDALLIEISLSGYNAFLEQSVDFEEKTAKRSVLLKELIERAGLKADINVTGLDDSEFTLKVAKAEAASTGSGGTGWTELNGNDCTPTIDVSGFGFDIDTCKGNVKIGNSTANYAQDTKNMSAKEAIKDIYNRFVYDSYYNNRRCPTSTWKKSGNILGNCADISRLVKCVGEVHGLKVGIHHWKRGNYGHYFNLIEVNGTVYRFDCCFKSGTTSSTYGGENCNNLTMKGGPWSN